MNHAHSRGPAAHSPHREATLSSRSAGRIVALALSGSLLLAGPAVADDIEDTSQKFTDVQKLGYLGRTSKHALNALRKLGWRKPHS